MAHGHCDLKNKKIVLGITGSIAAYKSAELIRILKELGAEVRVIMSAGANAFVTPMTLQALSNNRVFESLLDVESETTMSHIALARWADLILVAPSTAHFIAKLTMGFADDLLTTVCLASTAPIAIAPAMNVTMWSSPATQENIKKLIERNIHVIGPDQGIQACGETGEGRMTEPEVISKHIIQILRSSKRLHGKKILITAGPTQEPIDPVRYLTNHSSGKMGYAIARAAIMEGADVTLISGPTSLSTPKNVTRIDVVTAQEMLDSVMHHVSNCDVFISTAAVSDYRIVNASPHKIKKSNDKLQIELQKNPDILFSVSQLKRRPVVVGFAAETENIFIHAQQKLKEKKLDMIVANQVAKNKGFHSDYNELFVMTSAQEAFKTLSYAPKEQLATDLINILMSEILKL